MIVFHELNSDFSKKDLEVLNLAWDFFAEEKGLHDVYSEDYQIAAEYFHMTVTKALAGVL